MYLFIWYIVFVAVFLYSLSPSLPGLDDGVGAVLQAPGPLVHQLAQGNALPTEHIGK